MPRKLIVFGNGLGRSIDNDHFNLTSALNAVWADGELLTAEEKEQIASAIEGVDVAVGPEGEEQLLGTQLALIACEILKEATNDEALDNWLTVGAQGYPMALAKYTWAVARYFQGYDNLDFDDRWSEFVQSLVEFIHESKSHVATLNYDDLLYGPFNESHDVGGTEIRLCSGFGGTLLDGYTDGLGFSASNMRRLYNPESKAWYMHLHGSPLFIDNENGDATKITRNQLAGVKPPLHPHVVLTHGSMKPVVISNSDVLRMYWEHLDAAIEEVDEIIIFGYSGMDEHLNARIKRKRNNTPIKVVERNHEGDREQFWSQKFGSAPAYGPVEVVSLDNILNFRDW